MLFQVTAKRYEPDSVILTSNQSFRDCEQVFGGDNVLTSATLDRLVRQAYVVLIRGDSCRFKDKRKSGIVGQQIYIRSCRQGIGSGGSVLISRKSARAGHVWTRPQRQGLLMITIDTNAVIYLG